MKKLHKIVLALVLVAMVGALILNVVPTTKAEEGGTLLGETNTNSPLPG